MKVKDLREALLCFADDDEVMVAQPHPLRMQKLKVVEQDGIDGKVVLRTTR